MTDENDDPMDYITDSEKKAINVVKGQSNEDLERIIEKLNYDGIIIDNHEPSFHSSMAMNHWHPSCEEYLRKGREAIKSHYTGGTLIIGWTNEGNNYCLMDSNTYSPEEGVEYMESLNRKK